ncbi:Fe-S protein assembly co-chaperone HscB [Candidatus Thiosymbion oneisti]|uniref:Fe-S protein assembly co-chaperone HscB n=1 Tax=Candidatus Thiosymbion oneisti TaxID=589554 RepID=UPI000A84E406|nr:Fe-S protein assembly co-chaperone HscB [Candidatus Thiosymbion oneisti]
MLDFSKNHFELFGLPMSYRVDGDLLAERYHALQHALHPDRYAAAGARERRLSMQASTRVNEAFQTLKEPLARAHYLLSLHTGAWSDEPASTQDTAFLMEQMELREALAQVKDRPDPGTAVGEILDRLADHAHVLTSELEALLEAPSAPDLEAAQERVRKLQFVTKCRVEAENLEAELEGIS